MMGNKVPNKKQYLKDPQKYIERTKDWYIKNKEKKNIYDKKRYFENKDRIKEINKKWVSEHKDKVKEIKRKYRETHREKLRKSGRDYAKKSRTNNPEEFKKKRNLWRKNNPDKMKEEKLKGRFKISLIDYRKMLKDQNDQCGICGETFDFSNPNKSKYPCVDHCHKTKKVRGLLCRKCNSGTGGFHDDPELLIKAIKWLKNTPDFKDIQSHSKCNLKYKKYYLKIYGITSEDYLKILISQNNQCGICGKDIGTSKKTGKGQGSSNLDHCHKTGKIRGILCPECNRSLGLLNDNPEILSNAIKWLNERGRKNENS